QCNLTGTWDNDLGTTMTIGAVNSEGEFDGSYTTSGADRTNEIKTFPLRGFQHIDKEPTFGFTVRWTFSDSTSVFVGQCFVGEHGKEILKTTWLMRLWVISIHDNWKATR
ncbi:AVR6 protein, partial [Crypturellus soui]|nr:AVR6 protein [Crypturellus soui]NWI17423.1 AVR6 protein [Crypturellus soui]